MVGSIGKIVGYKLPNIKVIGYKIVYSGYFAIHYFLFNVAITLATFYGFSPNFGRQSESFGCSFVPMFTTF